MQWYKHFTTDRDELNSKLIRSKFGAKGYGIHLSLLEVIAQNVKVDNIADWGKVDPKHNIESLAIECACSTEDLQAFFNFVDEKGIYENRDNVLYYPEMLNRLDEYAQRVQRNAKQNGANGQPVAVVGTTPDIVGHKKKKEKKKEKKNNSKEINKEKTPAEVVLEKFNEVFGTKYKTPKAIEKNVAYWMTEYTLDEICKAVGTAKVHHFWKDKITPEILLRKKTPQGEDVDRIGEMLAYMPKKGFANENKEKYANL